jgi:hypothetical protein
MLRVTAVFRGLLYVALYPFCADQPNDLSTWCRGFVQMNGYTDVYVKICPKKLFVGRAYLSLVYVLFRITQQNH